MTDRNLKSEFDADEAAALQALGWRPQANDSDCPDPSLLIAAEEGVLDDAALGARIRAHAESCPMCRVLVADLAAVLAEEPSQLERERIEARVSAGWQPAPRRPSWWLTSAGLAAVAATLVLVFVPWRQLIRFDAPGVSDAGLSGAEGVAVPSVFSGSRPAIPRPEPQLTLRGEAPPVPVAEQIGQALDLADAGDLADAIAKLSAIANGHPDSGDAQLAFGATLLRADRMAEALPVLEKAKTLTGTASADEFEWYLAAALARSGETARATALLEPLCARNSLRGALACAGLAEIRKPR